MGIKNENILNKELAEDLRKPITIKFKIWKKQSPFINNICSADLADTQLVIEFFKKILSHYALLIFSVSTHGLFL